MIRKPLLLATAAFIVHPSISFAGSPASLESLMELSLEELARVQTSTLSRAEESVDEAPGSVYVFTSEVIQKRGYQSLKDILQVVPGFTV
mgnify:CR=1 FL=1